MKAVKARPAPQHQIPLHWHTPAHVLWLQGDRQGAIQASIDHYNELGPDKPASVVLQLAYYLFMIGDYAAVVTVLEPQRRRLPEHVEIALNLAVCYARLARHAESVAAATAVLELQPGHAVALDVLARAHYGLGNAAEAIAAGNAALQVKDRDAAGKPGKWKIPAESPCTHARRHGKKNVIAFSLWGTNPRYLRGALQNILRARAFFPGWQVRFYTDTSLPREFLQVVRQLSAAVVVHSGCSSLREKLCWRFRVANDPAVGYFLVRDCDSVIGEREALAVNLWLDSEKWFHLMRDWWTHTDPMLAGLWGGVAGILPSLAPMVAEYSSGKAETPNIDQWFLRDRVWPYVRQSCLIHDRLFRVFDSLPFPGPEPVGDYHVGQDEYAVRRDDQAAELQPLVLQYPELGNALGMPPASAAENILGSQ